MQGLKYIVIFFLWIETTVSVAAYTPWLFTIQDVDKLHRSTPTIRLTYGATPQAYGFLRIPEGNPPYPVAIVIHGGCWLNSLHVYAQSTEPLADALTAAGIATWNIEYSQLGQEGAGYPGTFLEVAAAADYLEKIADKYALDLSRVVVLGHSAGGQLAFWLAAREKIPQKSILYHANPLKLKAAISLGGAVDLKVSRVPAEKICGADVIGGLLGSTQQTVLDKRYQETSPMEMLPFTTPQILISGEKDQVVPTALSELYMQRAQASKDDAKLVVVPFAGHQEYIVPNSVVWPVLYETVKKYLSP